MSGRETHLGSHLGSHLGTYVQKPRGVVTTEWGRVGAGGDSHGLQGPRWVAEEGHPRQGLWERRGFRLGPLPTRLSCSRSHLVCPELLSRLFSGSEASRASRTHAGQPPRSRAGPGAALAGARLPQPRPTQGNQGSLRAMVAAPERACVCESPEGGAAVLLGPNPGSGQVGQLPVPRFPLL